MKNRMWNMAVLVVMAILVLSAGGSALAADVEPLQLTATGEVNPNDAHNDGASVLQFGWHIAHWEGTADRYTFAIHQQGNTTPIQIEGLDAKQDSDAGDTFPGLAEALQDISGRTGEEDQSPPQDINTPEGEANPGDTHEWTVPTSVPEGDYWAVIEMFLEGQAEAEATITISFDIVQATGDLDVHKIRTGTGEVLGGWVFTISGPTTDSDTTNSSAGTAFFSDIPVGDYTVIETQQGGWTNTSPDPGATSPQTQVTVNFDQTTSVTFENQELVGSLRICKEDETGVLLADWDFDISGPIDASGKTGDDDPGCVTFSNVPVGDYTVTETLKSGWISLDPGTDPPIKQASVEDGQTTTVTFVNQEEDDTGNGEPPYVPTLGQWGTLGMSGFLGLLLVWVIARKRQLV